jgi:uncharacterized protein (TIGR03000 family)
MYSVVLMAALTAGTTTPTWGWGGGGHGGGRGGHGARVSFESYGGCYGCFRGYGYGGNAYSSYGSSRGYGYSGSGYGCSGAGCHGCGGGDVHAPAPGSQPAAAPGGPAPEPVPAPKKEDKQSAAPHQASLIVDLPANAKLYVDDQLTRTTSERRVFNSPQLEEGQTYYYILRVEVVRDGKSQSATKRVFFHAGDVIQTSFLNLESLATAQAEPRPSRAEANMIGRK